MATTREKLIDWLADLPDETEIGIEDIYLVANDSALRLSHSRLATFRTKAYRTILYGSWGYAKK